MHVRQHKTTEFDQNCQQLNNYQVYKMEDFYPMET